MKVLMFDYRASEKEFFENNKFTDFDIKFFQEALNDKTKLNADDYEDTDVISVYSSSLLTKEVLKNFKNLRTIATRSFEFNHIDLDYCKKNNIAVLNVHQYGEEAVAQYTFGLIIALTRKMRQALFDIQKHEVNSKKYEGKLLNDMTIGIIGCGNVGLEIGKIADFFGMRILVSSYKEAPSFKNFCNIVPFDTLLCESDIITLHMPFTTETYQILGKEEFARMKEGVYIINTSSVDLIDIESLYNNLISNKVKGAGLDILDSDFTKGKTKELGNETMSTKDNHKITSKLIEMPNVIITPHIAFNTADTINYVLQTTINNIRDCTKGLHTNRVC